MLAFPFQTSPAMRGNHSESTKKILYLSMGYILDVHGLLLA